MDSGNTHSVCGADDSVIGFGTAQYGELGFGPSGPKCHKLAVYLLASKQD
jgi:alpha-tubulin suppressor-like RCC1 family protein